MAILDEKPSTMRQINLRSWSARQAPRDTCTECGSPTGGAAFCPPCAAEMDAYMAEQRKCSHCHEPTLGGDLCTDCRTEAKEETEHRASVRRYAMTGGETW